MKDTIKILGIIAIVAIIGFSMMACGDVDEPSLIGTWKNFGGTVKFNSDDTFNWSTPSWGGISGSYTTTSSHIYITGDWGISGTPPAGSFFPWSDGRELSYKIEKPSSGVNKDKTVLNITGGDYLWVLGSDLIKQ